MERWGASKRISGRLKDHGCCGSSDDWKCEGGWDGARPFEAEEKIMICSESVDRRGGMQLGIYVNASNGSEEMVISIRTRTSAVSSVFAGWTRGRVNTVWKGI
jgi:hypothetical protein